MPKRKDQQKEILPEKFNLKDVQNSAGGNFNTATRVEGKVRDHEIRLVRRSKRNRAGNPGPEDRETEMNMRLQLKLAGVPVIPTLRVDKKGDMYSTDLTKKGKNFVVSWTNVPFDAAEYDESVYSEEYAQPYARRGEILKVVSAICKTCADAGISIENGDGLFLVIDKKTRDTQVLAGDYKHYKKVTNPPANLFQQNLGSCYMLFATNKSRTLYGFASTEEIKNGLGMKE